MSYKLTAKKIAENLIKDPKTDDVQVWREHVSTLSQFAPVEAQQIKSIADKYNAIAARESTATKALINFEFAEAAAEFSAIQQETLQTSEQYKSAINRLDGTVETLKKYVRVKRLVDAHISQQTEANPALVRLRDTFLNNASNAYITSSGDLARAKKHQDMMDQLSESIATKAKLAQSYAPA